MKSTLTMKKEMNLVDDQPEEKMEKAKMKKKADAKVDAKTFYIFSAVVRYKQYPWSAVRSEEKILGRIPDSGLQDALKNGWGILSDFAKCLDQELLTQANVVFYPTESISSLLAQELMIRSIPSLKKEGWSISFDETFPFRIVNPNNDWYAVMESDPSQEDWFELELGVNIDNNRVNILPLLVTFLKSLPTHRLKDALDLMEMKQEFFLPLDDGRLLAIPAEKILNITRTLVELYDGQALTSKGRLRLNTQQAAQVAELESALESVKLRWYGAEKIRHLGTELLSGTGMEDVDAPKGLTHELRSYQKQGLSWLQFLRRHNMNGILADDMGLGKTIQTLAHILIEKESGRMTNPVLVIAPTSLMVNWRQESNRFTPQLKVLILQGQERKEHFESIPDFDLILTTYPLLGRDRGILAQHHYHYIILDEAQVVKNPNTIAHRSIQHFKANHRLCLTGTPMENHLGELWSLFHFLMPGFLGDHRTFMKTFRYPIEKQNDKVRRELLTRRVKPFLLRRTKQEVEGQLPPKTEIHQIIQLADDQRELYESIRLAMHERVRMEIRERGLNRSQIVILDALLKLRQVCCDPRLLKLEAAKTVKGSGKMDFLRQNLPEMIEENRRILLFSQFTSMLSIIEEELNELNIPYVILTGRTRDRQKPIQIFQEGQVPIFLISLKAGGTGLNLTTADTVIHYDPWWNPAVENQATDRAHRIGQLKPVFVYKLITEGTVEEKIIALQQKKSQLLNSFFDPMRADNDAVFTPEDLEALFAPLS